MSTPRQILMEWAEKGALPGGSLQRALRLTGGIPSGADWRRFLEQLLLWLGTIFLSAGVIFFLAFGTLKLRDSSSEVLPLESFEWHPLRQVSDWAETNLKRRNPIRRAKKARQRIRSIHTTESS